MKNKFAEEIRDKARKIANDEGKLGELLDMVKDKFNNLTKSDRLKDLFSTLEVFMRMIKCYLNGEYRDYPKRTLLLILFGLIYFLMPIDVIPDFIPLSGFIDDLSVLIWVYNSIQKDIAAFLEWEKQKLATD